MKSRMDRTWLNSYESVRALGSLRRHHEVRPFVRSHPSRNAVWGVVFALAATLGVTDSLRLAQEPTGLPPFQSPTQWPADLIVACDFLLPNDGIPRTYSYYYSPWLNQPRHSPWSAVRTGQRTGRSYRAWPPHRILHQWLAQ